jgi:DNA repair photolyase
MPDGDALDAGDCAGPRPGTEYLPDHAREVLTKNDSPDVGPGWTLNPYRGCEHGCIYCYARPGHEYFGYSAGLDFETRIFVKHDVAERLKATFARPAWTPHPIMMSGVTDCYQPVERDLRLTRKCLEVFAECRHPLIIVTKNSLVTRDLDLLAELARHHAVAVFLSITTLDLALNRILEPRSSAPRQRLDALRALSDAGIPAGVMCAPVIPAINDHEIPAILTAAAAAGARHAGKVLLRLPHAVAPLFVHWLEEHYPDRKEKVLNHLRSMRGGKLYDATFGTRMRGEGPYAEHLERLFRVGCAKAGLNKSPLALSTAAFRRPASAQLDLFEP